LNIISNLALNGRNILNYKFEKMWKKADMTY